MKRLISALVFMLTLSACGDWVYISDAGPKPDSARCGCRSDEVCVQSFDKDCRSSGPLCVKSDLPCFPGTCVKECETRFCDRPAQCRLRILCGNETPGAFNCYSY